MSVAAQNNRFMPFLPRVPFVIDFDKFCAAYAPLDSISPKSSFTQLPKAHLRQLTCSSCQTTPKAHASQSPYSTTLSWHPERVQSLAVK